MDPRLIATVVCAAAELFAVFRLVAIRAHRAYPWFVTYLIAGLLQSFIWLAGPTTSVAYVRAYRWTMPVIIALQAVVVLELWRSLLSCYRGIHRISKWLGVLVLLVGAGVAFSTGFDHLQMHGEPIKLVTFHWLMWAARYTGSILCIVCALLSFWAVIFDHGVPRNTSRHGELLAFYFGTQAIGFLVINLTHGTSPTVGIYTTLAAAAFYVVWGFRLTVDGNVPTERLMVRRPVSGRWDLRWVFRRLTPY
ncbi:MAG TPA: hypothetical protein VMG40_07645 [Bryobacteraceae bacterium]|nr:hypothetical protein [Bryobacteraceae bacterium]